MVRLLTIREVGDVLPRKDVRSLVERAHKRAGEPLCCDPRDLSDGLGIPPVPARTEVSFLRDGKLYYPERAALPARGLAIYRLLAEQLWPYANSSHVMLELILPEAAARSVPFVDLPSVQPHAPLTLVQSIFMSHGQSGVMKALRLP